MRYLMAANWKMYKNTAEAVQTLQELELLIKNKANEREVVICAAATVLSACSKALGENSKISLGGQNFYPALEGAFTGEISPSMLFDAGCKYVLVGHSERRAIFGETDEFVAKKTSFALEQGLNVILCIGETLEQREAGQLEAVLQKQLQIGLAGVQKNIEPEKISIAYEPVWAIGTGKVAGSVEIVQAHALIRACLKNIFPVQSQEIRILYGGSVKADNAKTIIALDNVNGVLVGGASLVAETFSKIILA